MNNKAPSGRVIAPDRNLALELVRVTEAAALACGRWVGRNDTDGARTAAITAMRTVIDTVDMAGKVVVGEGHEDDPTRISPGERIGNGSASAYDVALDPVDGITLTAKGLSNAISVLAVAPRGAMLEPPRCRHMTTLVGGRDIRHHVDIRRPVAENIQRAAKLTQRNTEDITVAMLARPHHETLAREVRETGARIRFLTCGTVTASIMAASPDSGIDLLIGTVGAPESVIASCAVKCLGGTLQGRLDPRTGLEREGLSAAGLAADAVLGHNEFVSGVDVFCVLTGITDGGLVQGVRYGPDTATTESLVMRARSGTIRRMHSQHRLDPLIRYSAVG
ncbi:MAG: class II fructose-bisphosphatase [Pseudonocardia sp.]|nr:class II fructose-bisphosphatase [Pseudonocardia sp.]MBO0877333.1 class II fructose-bisphosphatase [Pseudonocardia sp.]